MSRRSRPSDDYARHDSYEEPQRVQRIRAQQMSPGLRNSPISPTSRDRPSFDDADFDREINVNRNYSEYDRRREKSESERRSVTSPTIRQPQFPAITTLETIDIRSLCIGAPAHSVKQTIEVSRLEDELLDHLPSGKRTRQPSRHPDYEDSSPLDDYDKVDEKVELELKDEGAVLIAKVRSEKITPILGTKDMWKRSSVIVTRRIQVNLSSTPHRRQLYDLIAERAKMGGRDVLSACAEKEKSELYRVFMGLAELEKAAMV